MSVAQIGLNSSWGINEVDSVQKRDLKMGASRGGIVLELLLYISSQRRWCGGPLNEHS